MPRNVTQPAERASKARAATAQVKKRYKLDTSKRTKFNTPEETELVKDMVVILKLVNYSHTQIGMIVGVSRGQVREFLAEPKVQKKLLTLRERIPAAAAELMQAYLIEAVQAVVYVLRTEQGKDNALVLKAAAELFDRAGLPKLSRSESKTENQNNDALSNIGRGGHEGLLSEVANLTPEMQEKAAQLYDLFETGLKNLISEGKEETSENAVDG